MSPDIITSALDAEGRRVYIDKAEPSRRYRGATPHHQDCVLFPVFRRAGWRSPFAHVPRQKDACGRGESDVHREACNSWMTFFESQLNGCFICRTRGVESMEHICPAVHLEDGRLVQAPAGKPIHGEIVWTCRICLRVHMWDLLDGTVSATSNKRVPGLYSRMRPDITLLGEDDEVMAFIEFRKSHLSNTVRDVADDLDIPLFVVDIENTLFEFQTGLNNPRRGIWEAFRSPDMDPEVIEIDRKMAEASYRFDESIGQKGGVAGSFSVILDADGNPADVVFHAAGRSRALPEPSIGAYLVAGESNLPCESQKRWMMPPASS